MSFYLYRIKPRWTIDPPFFILSIYDEFISAHMYINGGGSMSLYFIE